MAARILKLCDGGSEPRELTEIADTEREMMGVPMWSALIALTVLFQVIRTSGECVCAPRCAACVCPSNCMLSGRMLRCRSWGETEVTKQRALLSACSYSGLCLQPTISARAC